MNDILFGNNNSKVITKLSKRYFKKNKVRNLAALLAIILTAFLFTSITSLAFNMASSIQLSLQMQKGSKADGTLGYMTEKQYEQLVNSDFVDQAGHRRIIGYASNTSSHSIEINYEDSVQQELTFCVPTHGAAPEKAKKRKSRCGSEHLCGRPCNVRRYFFSDVVLKNKANVQQQLNEFVYSIGGNPEYSLLFLCFCVSFCSTLLSS